MFIFYQTYNVNITFLMLAKSVQIPVYQQWWNTPFPNWPNMAFL